MCLNYTELLEERAPELYAGGTQELDTLQQQLLNGRSTYAGIPQPDLLSFVKLQAPGYTEPENTADRAALSAHAAEQMALGAAQLEIAHHYGELPEGAPKALRALFDFKQPEQSAETARILREGTPFQKHRVFTEAMERLAAFNPEKTMAATDKRLVHVYPSLIRSIDLAYNSAEILNYMRTVCDITPEEEDRFRTLGDTVLTVGNCVKSRMDTIVSPCYAMVDTEQLLALGHKDLRELEESMPPDSQAELFFANLTGCKRALEANPDSRILASAAKALNGNEELIFTPDKTGAVVEGYFPDRSYLKDLHEGKTVYAVPMDELDLPVNQRHPVPVRDFTGNGNLTVVPEPVEEPGGVARFFHRILTAVGLPGVPSCNKYDEYLRQTEALAAEAKEHDSKPDYYRDFKTNASAVNTNKEKRSVLDSQRQLSEKYMIEEARIDARMDAVVGPNAHELKAWEVVGNFSKDEYAPGKLEFNRSGGFTDRELSLIAFAGLSNAEVANRDTGNQFCSREAFAGTRWTHMAVDVIIQPRSKANGHFAAIENGRIYAKECLDLYCEKKPEALGKLLGDAVKHQTTFARGLQEVQAQTAHIMHQTDRMMDILDKHPDLMQHSGLTEENLTAYRGMSAICKAFVAGQRAAAELQEYHYNGTEPTAERRAELLADVFAGKIVTHLENEDFLTFNRSEASKAFDTRIEEASKQPGLIKRQIHDILEADPQADVSALEQQSADASEKLLALSIEHNQLQAHRPLSKIGNMLGGPAGDRSMDTLRQGILESPTFKELLNKPMQEFCSTLANEGIMSKLTGSVMQDSARSNAAKAVREDAPVVRPRSSTVVKKPEKQNFVLG